MRNIPEWNDEGGQEHEHDPARPECGLCEQMLADALDETLGTADRVWFERHVAGCDACRQVLAEAKQGAAWLDMLKMSPPEPSAALFDRIIAQTSGAALGGDRLPTMAAPGPQLVLAAAGPVLAAASPLLPEAQPGMKVLEFRPRQRMGGFTRMMLEPRLAMTAAMAFFSIALTMNLLGVRLDDLHATALRPGDLRPENLRHSFFAARASAVRSYDNLRVVHVMESRLEDIQSLTDAERTDRQPESQPAPETQVPARGTEPAGRDNQPREQDRNEAPAAPGKREQPVERSISYVEPQWPVHHATQALNGRNGGLS